jgi:membrane protein implicated in regulation of membrane protease activity
MCRNKAPRYPVFMLMHATPDVTKLLIAAVKVEAIETAHRPRHKDKQRSFTVSSDLIWIIAGFALVIIELMTGTFYLLVLGLGAFAAALAAFLGAPFLVQAIVAGLVAMGGAWWVNGWHRRNAPNREEANVIDKGQSVTFERWVDAAAGTLRVRYRGVEWDARLQGSAPADLATGRLLYIQGQEGQVWVVGPGPKP